MTRKIVPISPGNIFQGYDLTGTPGPKIVSHPFGTTIIQRTDIIGAMHSYRDFFNNYIILIIIIIITIIIGDRANGSCVAERRGKRVVDNNITTPDRFININIRVRDSRTCKRFGRFEIVRLQ
jgi:hypothetical protein